MPRISRTRQFQTLKSSQTIHEDGVWSAAWVKNEAILTGSVDATVKLTPWCALRPSFLRRSALRIV
jgi:isopentenyldiphosphate isomerase